ncbi:MAG TPA: hypothetical protein VFP97_16665 [Chitinophagaceae bacterium]|nr:hypothetical protein [Chitinophagaceae bacterium]
MRHVTLLPTLLLMHNLIIAQADNEIQVYASPTIEHKWTIFEVHNNYTFKGSKLLADPKAAKWYNTTLEITHGFGNNFEIGFYTFAGIEPSGGYTYLGNQIRPRVTVPEKWKWPFGVSLSAEFGFFRPDDTTDFFWQGEIRPIIDKTWGDLYLSFNPNIDFAISGDDKGIGFSPQFKAVYTMQQKVGFGFEYYGGLGEFKDFLPLKMQEHLLGPIIDLYIHPMWEIQGGFLFGLTENSNQRVLKLLLGKRIKKS